jgi:hypothetical protein
MKFNCDDNMRRIKKICDYITRDIYSDTKLKDYYFEIKYEEKLIISLIKIYAYYDDEKDRIRHKKIYGKVEELNMNLKEYCNLIINIYEWKLAIGKTSDIQTEKLAEKIKIQYIK